MQGGDPTPRSALWETARRDGAAARAHGEKAERNRAHGEKGRSPTRGAQPPRRPQARPRPHAPCRSTPRSAGAARPAAAGPHRGALTGLISHIGSRHLACAIHFRLPRPAPGSDGAASGEGIGVIRGRRRHFVFKGAALRFVRSRWVRGCCRDAELERARAAGPGRPADNPPQPSLRGRSRPASVSRRGTGRGRGSPHRSTMRFTGGRGNKLPFFPPPHPGAVRIQPGPALRLPRGFPRVPPPTSSRSPSAPPPVPAPLRAPRPL